MASWATGTGGRLVGDIIGDALKAMVVIGVLVGATAVGLAWVAFEVIW